MKVTVAHVNPTRRILYCDNAFENGNLGDATKQPREEGHAEPAEWIRAEGHRLVPYCRSCMASLVDDNGAERNATVFDYMPAWRLA